MELRLLGDEKESKTKNMAGGGVSEIQYQNNVNPFEICNNWIQSVEYGFLCYHNFLGNTKI